ncbi:hypothetical protein [Falsiroseomonas tokyonensis]|uniref:Uncharacterized protein n=1 Tax=Falsiroseomonas tokyonensis TaxID=430521 RepID=A0ABV7BZ20_9PROT|nr:hypothetical protein [Falsiroseomonas tokyonensis]MBU8540791.1 hypothetical protein [Falsiroseomonas tokyonensis]
MTERQTVRHPAAVRWQPAHGNCANPVQPPVASDIGGAPCKLIWVRRDDWDAFLAWQADGGTACLTPAEVAAKVDAERAQEAESIAVWMDRLTLPKEPAWVAERIRQRIADKAAIRSRKGEPA